MKNILMFYNELMIDFVKISLEGKGINVIGFSNVEEAILKIENFAPVLIILDEDMATNVNDQIKSFFKTKIVPTAMLVSSSHLIKNPKQWEVDFIIKKNVQLFEELNKVVDKVI